MILLQHDELTSPCVYVVKKSDVPTYIGVGAKGMRRVFSFGMADSGEPRDLAISECDAIEVWFFPTEEEAREQEKQLIHDNHPQHNRFCSLCNFYYKKYPQQFRKRGQLFGIYKNAILSLLLSNPEKAYHVREVAYLTNLTLSPVQRELKNLSQFGILKRLPKMGNRVYYRAEKAHPIYPELKSLVSKGA